MSPRAKQQQKASNSPVPAAVPQQSPNPSSINSQSNQQPPNLVGITTQITAQQPQQQPQQANILHIQSSTTTPIMKEHHQQPMVSYLNIFRFD